MGNARQDVALLILRLSGIYLAWGHGVGKLQRLASGEFGPFIEGVGKMGFPMPTAFAWAAAIAETAGFLVAVGLLTRIAAGLGAATMAVAALLRHHAPAQFGSALGLTEVPAETLRGWGSPELALIYFLCLVALVLLGPGRYSLDALIRRRRGAK